MFHSKIHLHNQNQNQNHKTGTEQELDRLETEREEVRCSDWEDCYGSTSSSDRDEVIAGLKSSEKSPEFVAGGEVPVRKDEEVNEEKVKMKHKDLKEIVEVIRENFEKAAVAGDRLSEMLQISRAQLDRSFSQLKSKIFILKSVCLLRKCGKIL